jgi:Eukaryotic protein of unknown function (DUF866)
VEMQELQSMSADEMPSLVKLLIVNTKREHSANVKDAPKPYQQSSPSPGVIIELDCRGLEFVEFSPQGEWVAQGDESGTPFVGIDLQEGEWYDFDEKASREVSITELKWDIRRV